MLASGSKAALINARIRLPKPSEKPPFQTWKEIQKRIDRGGLTDQEAEALWDCLFLSEKEVLELLGHVKTRRLPIRSSTRCSPSRVHGARGRRSIRSEISDFDFDRKSVLIRKKKRKRGVRESYRQVQLNARLEAIMREWLAGHPGGKLTICSKPDHTLTRDAAHHHFAKENLERQ